MSDLIINMDLCPLVSVNNHNIINGTMKFVLEFDVPLNHAESFGTILREHLETNSCKK
jgi:hypothetical protein